MKAGLGVLRSSVEVIPEFEVLLCPVCGFYNVHLVSVKVATGSFEVAVDSSGARFLEGFKSEDSRRAVENRGVRVVLEYVCENEHHGELVFQFHEGVTFVEHKPLKPLERW
ncbi:MAG: hypothetical protein QXO67_04245 [Candidatus Bathyarchaeia archaeon]